jgi:hypothetical protein
MTDEEIPEVKADDFSDLDPGNITGTPGAFTGSRSRSTGTGARRGRKPGSARITNIQKKLSGEMFQIGTMAGLVVPVTGYYIAQESDNFTRAIVELASRRPEWLRALEQVADIQPGLVVGRTVLGIGASLAVDRGRADPEKQMMRFLGVYSAWQAIHSPNGERAEGSAYRPPPSTFTPVS